MIAGLHCLQSCVQDYIAYKADCRITLPTKLITGLHIAGLHCLQNCLQDYIAYKTFIKAKESVGMTMSLGIAFFESGRLPEDDFLLLRENDYMATEHFDTFLLYSDYGKAR